MENEILIVNKEYDDLIESELQEILDNHDKQIEDTPLDLSIPEFSDSTDYSLEQSRQFDNNLRAKIINDISKKIKLNISHEVVDVIHLVHGKTSRLALIA